WWSEARGSGRGEPWVKHGTTTETRGIARRVVTSSERDVEERRQLHLRLVEAGVAGVDEEIGLGPSHEADERAGACERTVTAGSRPGLEPERRRVPTAGDPRRGTEEEDRRNESAAPWSPGDELHRRLAVLVD